MKQSNFNLYVIADALDHFRLMDDPYEYHDCEGVESIEDIAFPVQARLDCGSESFDGQYVPRYG